MSLHSWHGIENDCEAAQGTRYPERKDTVGTSCSQSYANGYGDALPHLWGPNWGGPRKSSNLAGVRYKRYGQTRAAYRQARASPVHRPDVIDRAIRFVTQIRARLDITLDNHGCRNTKD
jgi:hypothetical protein